MRYLRCYACVSLVSMLAMPLGASAQSNYEGYYRFLNDVPGNVSPFWANDAQGLAHDDGHWFITNNAGTIWKIPASSNLCCTSPWDPDVLVIDIDDIPELDEYEECKDPVCHEFQGRWYLFVPVVDMEAESGATVAVFDASTLAYLDHAALAPDPEGGAVLNSWCAIDGAGELCMPYIYYDPSVHSGVARYSIAWETLADPMAPALSAPFHETISLLGGNGQWLHLEHPQGGEFSPSGDLLYVVSGYLDDTEEEQISEGIHVFETTTWTRVQHSTNGHGMFNYAYNPDGPINEEPQGVTIWDLDFTSAANGWGQLHVLLLDNDCGCLCPVPDCDDVYIKHYTHRIWVNQAAPPPPLSGFGTLPFPFLTVAEAASMAWSDSEIAIWSGDYPENLTIAARTRLTAVNGVVRIGSP